MTTILADTRHGVMCADSNFGDGDTRGQMRKVWRIRSLSALVGLAGNLDEMAPFLLWLRDGMQPPGPRISHLAALMLQPHGMLWFDGSCAPIVVQSPCTAIGTGAKAALAAHDALGGADPARAVRIACRYDANSRPPVRTYRI